MIRINLLPFRAARKKENIRRQISIFVLSFGLVLIVLFYYNIHLGGKIKHLKTTVDETKQELAKYKKITDKIEDIKKKLAVLEKKTGVIQKLERNRFEPVELLDTMSTKIIAKRMWFTSFVAKSDNVNINGVALDNKTVADFMTRLEGTGLFSTVQLKSISKQTIKSSNLKKFQILCTKKTENKAEAPKKSKKGAKRKK
jgi:type IV pilus assembly protein PilN